MKKCWRDGCGRPATIMGLCSNCYDQKVRWGSHRWLAKTKPLPIGTLVCECTDPQLFAWGECTTCHRSPLSAMHPRVRERFGI
jgi:hypothetical protein